LIQECISWAQAHGLAVMKLGVTITNISAIRCYARCGFTVYGIDPKAIYWEGAFYDELLMAKMVE
jgi:RimJ/RimL family protein N-acetyltransferase